MKGFERPAKLGQFGSQADGLAESDGDAAALHHHQIEVTLNTFMLGNGNAPNTPFGEIIPKTNLARPACGGRSENRVKVPI